MFGWTCCVLCFSLDMFDKTRSGRIDMFGFSALWDFMQRWRALFQQYDRDRSGSISGTELHQGIPVCICQRCYDELGYVCVSIKPFRLSAEREKFTPVLFLPPLLKPSLRWATTSAPSSLTCWCSVSPCGAGGPASSWTASSRCAPSSKVWHRPSGKRTRPWRATSASTMRTSSLVPSPGSCEPHATDSPSALWIHSIIPCSGLIHMLMCHIDIAAFTTVTFS